ncbi:MAG: hypothetical protein KDC90_09735, partial [Ignavibacteriae bacterium]|nr:hypothetical protein [Ignavibacteriota bacterium]
MIKKLSALFLILVLFQPIIFAQFKIDQLSSDFDQLKDSLFLGITKTRSLQSLNDNWKVLYTDEAGSISEVSFPIKFTSTNTIIFEKEFSIASDKLLKNFIKLNFLGLNYSAEIFLNNATIYKHAGGEIPFSIDLTENMLNYDIPNTLRIKIQYDINSENTIPLLQRFLFPINFGGVFRDVYLSFKPKIGIKDASYKLESENKPYAGKLTFEVQLENFSKLIPDSLLENYDGRFKIQSSVRLSNDTNSIYFNIWNINPVGKDDYTMDFYFKIKDIANWSPKSPISYIATFKLTNGDNFVY